MPHQTNKPHYITLAVISDAVARAQSVDEILHETEIETFLKLSEQKQLDYVAGRIALKHAYICHEKRVVKMNTIAVTYTKEGIPYIQNEPLLVCSISHSQNWGVACISSYPLGIDIEQIRSVRPSLLSYIAQQQEIRLLGAWHSEQVTATRLWTIKEAVMKALGKGFQIRPKDIEIRSADDETCEIRILDAEYKDRQHWSTHSYTVHNTFIMSIAYECYQPTINWYQPTSL